MSTSSSSSTEIRSSSESSSSSNSLSSSSSTEIRSSSSSSTEIRSSSSLSSSSYIENWSSSSSSSSYLDYHDDRSIPFIFEAEESNPIWALAFNGEDVYAGTGSEGIVLKSTDRRFWSNIYQTDDIHVTALNSQGDQLFIGTSPSGKIYIMDISLYETNLSAELGGTIYDFCYFKDKMYAAGGIPSQIYAYNTSTQKWDVFYKPYDGDVNRLFIFKDKMYVIMDGPNLISFDGNVWKLETTDIDNISSFRNVTLAPYSEIASEFINRKNIITTDNMDKEIIYDIFPLNYATGLKSIDSDGDSLVLGTSNYGEIYNYTNNISNSLTRIFQTESQNTVNAILNLNFKVNLAAIDNKLYLIDCRSDEEVSEQEFTTVIELGAITTTTTTALAEINKTINITNPLGGEVYTMGDALNIRWTSDKGYNDAIRIELYKAGQLFYIIDSQTSNDGSYEWAIPDMTAGSDYQILLTWLSASSNQSQNQSISGNFSIVLVGTTTTTTTVPLLTSTTTTASYGNASSAETTTTTTTLLSFSNCRGIPILELEDEYITTMAKDVAKGGILMGTSNGRILGCNESTVNAYLTGDRKVYAEVKDGFGNVSDTVWTSFFYALYNRIAEINADKEIIKWQFEKKSSAIKIEEMTGIFLSPIMDVKEDFGQWKQLTWQETKPLNTDIVICVRASNSLDDLKELSWDYCFTSNDSDRGYGMGELITRELRDYQIRGRYIQFKVIMTSIDYNTSPMVVKVGLTYTTAFAVYFFTTRLSLEKGSDTQSGTVIASITEPQNTEIKFGITNLNSADWNDYQEVKMDKIFELNKIEDLKVGIKMTAYDENIPEVAEFALLTGANKDSLINEL